MYWNDGVNNTFVFHLRFYERKFTLGLLKGSIFKVIFFQTLNKEAPDAFVFIS